MKKYMVLFLIMITSFFYGISGVNAATLYSQYGNEISSSNLSDFSFPDYGDNENAKKNKDVSTPNSINYDITSFSINDSSINMTGWSFIDHMDNYGGYNLATYIVAYTGSWTDDYHTFTTCDNSANCKRYAVNEYIDKNLYYTRCGDAACELNETKYNTLYKFTYKGKKRLPTIDSCTKNQDGYGAWGGTHCMYRNVGFRISIPISNLTQAFGYNTDIKFRILSRTTTYSKNNKNKWKVVFKTDSSDLGVHQAVCESSLGSSACQENGGTYTTSTSTDRTEGNKIITTTTTRSFNLGGVSNKVLVTAVNVAPYTNNGGANGVISSSSASSYVLERYCEAGDESRATYTTTSVSDQEVTIQKGNGSYRVRVYGLKIQNTPTGKRTTGSSCDSTYQYAGLLLPATGSTYKVYYAPASWVKSTGNLSIKVTENSTTTIKRTDYCIGENCEGGDPPSNLTPGSCQTNLSSNVCTTSSFSLSNKNNNQKKCTKSLNQDYYYKVPANKMEELFGTNVTFCINRDYCEVKYDSGTNSYYFPITFYANVKFEQEATITPNFPNQSATPGRFFTYSSNVNLKAWWNYNGTYGDNTSGDNTYKSTISARLSGANQSLSIKVRLKVGEKIYFRNSNGTYSEVVYNGVSFYKNLVKNNISNEKGVSSSSDLTGENTVIFDNSNTVGGVTTTPGVFSCSNYQDSWSNENSRSIQMDCSYHINQAYIKVVGKDYGNIIYSAITPNPSNEYLKASTGGDAYYIPLNMKKTDVFRFYINFSKLNLLKNFKINYNATCKVTAGENQLTPNGGVLRYRPIDTSNPFPTGEIPFNWQQYINKYGNLNRITKLSYQQISYLTKKISDTKKSSLENYGSYTNYSDMNANGHSSVINDQYFEQIHSIFDKNHCASGRFRDDCDVVLGG